MLKLIKEEKTVKVEPVNLPEAEEIAVQEKQKEIDEKIAVAACEDSVTDLMQQAWDFISSINSVIATLDLHYNNEEVKKDVLELLNYVADESTVNIGMLQKISDLMNIKKVDLLDAGEDKAEEFLDLE